MKRKVLIGASLWLVFISVLHITLNVGWAEFRRDLSSLGSEERRELVVGFLPVT